MSHIKTHKLSQNYLAELGVILAASPICIEPQVFFLDEVFNCLCSRSMLCLSKSFSTALFVYLRQLSCSCNTTSFE